MAGLRRWQRSVHAVRAAHRDRLDGLLAARGGPITILLDLLREATTDDASDVWLQLRWHSDLRL